MAKPYARQFYSSKAWQDCRNEYAKKVHHLCENCLRQGIYKPGEIVHHRIEISPLNIDKPEITLNQKNLELLCRTCHREKHKHVMHGWAKVNAKKREAKEALKRYRVKPDGTVVGKHNDKEFRERSSKAN